MSQLRFPIRSNKLSLEALTTGTVANRQTKFQKVEIVQTEVFGKALLLDGHIQLTDFDEKAYHEALVWVPLLNISHPKSALVVGGGDGGVIRELCRHPNIDRIDMVEIDSEVVEICKVHMPQLSNGAFENSRVNLHIADAFEFVKSSTQFYDLIVVDCTDVYEEEEGELSEMLFTNSFYTDLLDRLSPEGFVVTQADNLVFCPYSLDEILALFRQVFPETGSYWGLVPSFGGFSGFVWGSKGPRVDSMKKFEPIVDLDYLTEPLYRASFSNLRFAETK